MTDTCMIVLAIDELRQCEKAARVLIKGIDYLEVFFRKWEQNQSPETRAEVNQIRRNQLF